MRITYGISAGLLFAAAPAASQDQQGRDVEEAAEKTREQPGPVIVVTADKREQRTVLAGSRIPRRPTVIDGPIATSTGTRGLVPGSGMDPAGQYTKIKRSRECVSDNIVLSKAASCIMADAQEAFVAGDLAAANDRYAVITQSPNFAPAERLEAARWQYRIAEQSGNETAREAALQTMVTTGAMGEAQELAARRSLVAMAASTGRDTLTAQRLAELDASGDARATDLVQLAILMRQMETQGAEDVMVRAIAMQEANGGAAPQGWHDFAGRIGL